VEKLAQTLFEHKYKKNRLFVDTKKIRSFADDLVRLLYPQLSKIQFQDQTDLEIHIHSLKQQLMAILNNLRLCNQIYKYDQIIAEFFGSLDTIEELLDEDAESIYEGDPAAHGVDEVIVCYPGFYAIAIYRFAHEFHKLNIPSLPRLLSEYAHQLTGVDINPGAKIGRRFCIDHGTGIVIGETAEIGNNVKIYQGVTLGALSVDKAFTGQKRHPTIEDNCVVYSNATILGGKTVIGANSVVGGNVWLTESVPPNSLVYQKSEIHLKSNKKKSPIEE
jgi:serine O-acetyltransferase